MSARGLNVSNYLSASVNLTTGTRTTLVGLFRIPLYSAMNSFNPAWSADLNGSGGAPAIGVYGDNGPAFGTLNDDGSGAAGVAIPSPENVWRKVSVSTDGPHSGAFQAIRTGVDTSMNTGSRGTTATAANFAVVKIGSTAWGGSLNGDALNIGLFNDLTDTNEDALRGLLATYWLDTLPSPYATSLKWSRRLSTDYTTGFGAGSPSVAAGSVTLSATGDPAITVYAGATPTLKVMISGML